MAKTKTTPSLQKTTTTRRGTGNTVTTSDDDILRVFEYASSLMQNQKMSQKKERPFGAAKGKFVCPDDIDFCNDEIAEMFGVNE